MIDFIKDKIAQRRFKGFLWTIGLAVGLFGVGYLIGANRELIADLISGE